jgi:GDP-4-dehydro-6-deoxy-D-mannose reductase
VWLKALGKTDLDIIGEPLMRILLTGATGFAGGHLAAALLAHGSVELHGVSRHADWPAPWLELAGQVALRSCDLCSPAEVEAVLREVRPEQIYHLAGYANAGRSFAEPDAAWAGNLTSTRNLYDAILRWGGRPRILFVGSGLVYGDMDDPAAVPDENFILRPNSPYASSKAAADLMSYQYSVNPGLDVIRARPFNHTGPRQLAHYAIPNFARQIAAIERGQAPPILETGNLSACRDLTDVRDMAAAYLLLMERGRIGAAYNIASGKSWSMQEVLDRLLALAGLKVEIRPRADLLRKTDLSVVRVDAGKLRRETGWTPRYSLDQTLTDTLAFWRTQ